MARVFLDVNPRILHVPPSRVTGAVASKLGRQLAQFGKSTRGMPILEISRCANGELMINSGVTRATRVAMLLPGQSVRVEVIDNLPNFDLNKLPRIGDFVP